MLSLPPSVRIFVATQPVDGRKGFDSLAAIVRSVFQHDPSSGHLYVFFSRRFDRVRILYWDRSGFAMWTNNRRERELRKLVLGRRNWLFTWLDLGGERTAHILSIVATAIAHEINPRAYLHVVIKLLVEGWPAERLRELLPDRIGAQHPELVVEPALSNEAVPLLSAAV